MQLDSRGRKRPAPNDDEEPLDWQRYQKYDVFNDLLTAAAASPAAQVLSALRPRVLSHTCPVSLWFCFPVANTELPAWVSKVWHASC